MRLVSAQIGPDHRGTVQLVLAEVLNNIVEHAYPDAPGKIELELGATSTGLSALVSDHGKPLPWSEVRVETAFPAPDPRKDLREGGFGWHIITTLATDVRYVRDSDVNRLWLMIPAVMAAKTERARRVAKGSRRIPRSVASG